MSRSDDVLQACEIWLPLRGNTEARRVVDGAATSVGVNSRGTDGQSKRDQIGHQGAGVSSATTAESRRDSGAALVERLRGILEETHVRQVRTKYLSYFITPSIVAYTRPSLPFLPLLQLL